MKDQMFRYLQRFGILLFFCTCMGAIIMADCTMAIGITERDRGLAASFSENTMRFSLMQADTPDSWTNGDLLDFLNTTGKSGIPVRLLKKTSTGAGELYTTEEGFFPGEDREGYGVLVRTDQKTVLTENDQIYYQGNSYPVVGEYTSELTPENCLIDMKGVLSDRSEYAMEGIFYLDCGSSTAAVYAALSGAGTAKYPAAQFTVLEESARGNLRKRLGESPDAVYYLLTMALLAMLNLLNFGNVAGYWVSERRKRDLCQTPLRRREEERCDETDLGVFPDGRHPYRSRHGHRSTVCRSGCQNFRKGDHPRVRHRCPAVGNICFVRCGSSSKGMPLDNPRTGQTTPLSGTRNRSEVHAMIEIRQRRVRW